MELYSREMKKIFGYIYKTTNLINGKIYVGKHESSFTNSVYLGSGVALKSSIKKHGRDNFKKEVRRELHIEHFAHYIRSGKVYRRYGLKFRYKTITYEKS